MVMSNMTTFNVAGVSFEGRQEIICELKDVWDGLATGSILGTPAVWLEREPDNAYDANAIKVMTQFGQIGYVPAKLAAYMAHELDEGLASYLTALVEIRATKKGGLSVQVSTYRMDLPSDGEFR